MRHAGRATRSLGLILALSCVVAADARAGQVLTSDPLAPAITDNPMSFVTYLGSATSGGVNSQIARDIFTGKLIVQYTLPVALLSGLGEGDAIAFSGFSGLGTTIQYATPPWGGPLDNVPPVPYQVTRSGDGLITLEDFRRITDTPGPIAIPLQIRIGTDAVGSYTTGGATLYRDGSVVATFDTLVPTSAPEPTTLALAASAVPVGLICWRRRRAATARRRGGPRG